MGFLFIFMSLMFLSADLRLGFPAACEQTRQSQCRIRGKQASSRFAFRVFRVFRGLSLSRRFVAASLPDFRLWALGFGLWTLDFRLRAGCENKCASSYIGERFLENSVGGKWLMGRSLRIPLTLLGRRQGAVWG